MESVLSALEYLAKYGLIEIFFGIGALGIISRLVSRVIPSNLDELHVSADFADRTPPLFFVQISNAGGKNIYISRAYFKPRIRRWLFIKNRYALAPSLRENFKDITHNFYELKFGDGTREYDCLLKPGYKNRVSTAIQLESMPSHLETGAGLFGKVVIEYATYGRQGKHVILV